MSNSIRRAQANAICVDAAARTLLTVRGHVAYKNRATGRSVVLLSPRSYLVVVLGDVHDLGMLEIVEGPFAGDALSELTILSTARRMRYFPLQRTTTLLEAIKISDQFE